MYNKYDRVLKTYELIKDKYSLKPVDNETRIQLKTELTHELDDEYEFICDETNNTPDIVELQCIVVKVMYKNHKFDPGYNYVNLIFGSEENIQKVSYICNSYYY